ncbi:unannotated protein [freshwater metagenome]|uniref:peptidylprolyl isomerase n=1 Tax=freshwater metagenome TaxID=449393 RepID=A0A6J7GZ24_9ZZZZ|nr:trigger factor [Actinomycetota bacterium]
MKSAVETLSPTRVKLDVEVPFEDLAASLDKAYKTIAASVSIPGFRKGKIPARIIDQRVGRGAVLEEAVNAYLPEAYAEAVRESGVRPVGRPDVEVTGIEDGKALTFSAEVDVRPEFDLPAFDSIVVEVAAAEVTEEDIDKQLTSLRSRFASLTPVERAAADGDVLLVDIAGFDEEGNPVDDLVGNAMSYELGTEGLLPGFDEAVAGATAGETRTFEFSPEVGEFEGRTLEVKATVTAVRERILPAADDDFAGMASEFDTIEELRKDMTGRIAEMKKVEQMNEARQKVLQALLDALDIPLPEGAITAEVEEHFADGHGDDEHREAFIKDTRDGLKTQFILDKIGEGQEIPVGEAELSGWLVQQAPRYGVSPDQLAQALVENGQVDMAFVDIRRGKALTIAAQGARIVDPSGAQLDLSGI